MSLITRCPACSTMFRVVADQLRVSDGWVRCGHCAEVFDAWANEATAEQVAASRSGAAGLDRPEEPSRQTAPPPEPPPGISRSASEASAAGPAGTESPVPPPPVAAQPEEAPAGASVASGPPVSEGGQQAGADAAQVRRERRRDRSRLRAAEPAATVATATPAASSSDAVDTPAEPLPAFLQAPAPAPAVRTGLSVAWGVACLLLLTALALQVLVSQRDRLATWIPESRLVLDPLCTALGCQIGPLKDPQALRIDSSAFNKIRGDLYRLSFTVSNTSAVGVGTPAMELSLTDFDDRVVARRVLAPSDLPQSPAILGPGQSWSGQWTVSVVASELDGRVAGYRLLAFYP